MGRGAKTTAAVVLALASIGGGAWYYVDKEERAHRASVQRDFEHAVKVANELKQALGRQRDLLKHAESLRAEEEAAGKSGNTARQTEARNARVHVEAEAEKQAALVQQREIAAAAARDEASKTKSSAGKR